MQKSSAELEPSRPPGYPMSGWVEAGLYVFAIAVLSLTYVVGHQLGAHPIAFVLYAMLASAIVLLAVTGPGPNARAVMLAPQTLSVGAGTIGMEIFYYQLLAHIAPAHGSLLVRFAIPVSMIVGFFLFKRRPAPLAILGAGIVTAGIVPLLMIVPGEHRLEVFLVALASAVSFNLRGFSAEFHPWNRQARTVMEKLQVTGLIVLVTSIGSIVLAATAALLMRAGVLPATSLVPSAAQMVHVPTILLSVLVGSVILTAMAYLGFSAVVKITTENFTATSAFTPVATLVLQLLAGALGLLPVYVLEPGLLPAMGVVVGGVLLILYAARRR